MRAPSISRRSVSTLDGDRPLTSTRGDRIERPLSKPELGFYEKAKALVKGLPAAPKGWEVHPEEVTPPAKLCTESDALFKKGGMSLNDPVPGSGRRLADALLQPTRVSDTNPYEFYLMAPTGVQLVLTSLGLGEGQHSDDEYERAIAEIEEPRGEWPLVGDRMLKPESIVSVDVLTIT